MKKTRLWIVVLVLLAAGFAPLQVWARKRKVCDVLERPENGYFVGGLCSNEIGSVCAIRCKIGYQVKGSTVRKCSSLAKKSDEKASWSGLETFCHIKKCPKLEIGGQLIYNCSSPQPEFGSTCYFKCPRGYWNSGSAVRHCLAIELWSGIPAKCRKIDNFQEPSEETVQLVSSTTTTVKPPEYQDLTHQSIIFGHSFRKIALKVDIAELPASFRIWMRTNYTKNIKLLSYALRDCAVVSVYSTTESNLLIKLESSSFEYNTIKVLKRNEWIQLAFVQTNTTFKVYFDGVPEIDLLEFEDVTKSLDCLSSNSTTKMGQNTFRLVNDINSADTDMYQPFRGEITKAYLMNDEMDDESILNSLYSCETSLDFVNKTLAFDWSSVLMDSQMFEFRRRPSGFCRGCRDPELIKHSFIFYDGTRIGDTRSYSCVEGFETVGVPVSVCMVYGSWNHRAPRCKKIHNQTASSFDLLRPVGKYQNFFYKVPEFMLNVEPSN